MTQSLEMAESMVLAALAFTHHPPVVALYVTAAVGGTLLALDNPLRRSFVTEMVPAGDRPNAVVLYSLIVNVGRVFGPALAGLLAITVGYGWCFSVDAASYLVVLAALWLMRPAELYRGVAASRAKGQIRAGLRYVADTPNLWISFGMLGGRRVAQLQLRRHPAPVRHPGPARRGQRVHPAVRHSSAPGRGGQCAGRRQQEPGAGPPHHRRVRSVLGIADAGALAAAPERGLWPAPASRSGRGRDQHSLYDLDHGHHPSRSRPGVARSDPRRSRRSFSSAPLPIGGPYRRFAGRHVWELAPRSFSVAWSAWPRPCSAGWPAGLSCAAASVGPSTTDESRSTMPLTTMDDMPALVVIDLQKGTVATPTAHPVDEVVQRAARLAQRLSATSPAGGAGQRRRPSPRAY